MIAAIHALVTAQVTCVDPQIRPAGAKASGAGHGCGRHPKLAVKRHWRALGSLSWFRRSPDSGFGIGRASQGQANGCGKEQNLQCITTSHHEPLGL
jgi:hypothetical protein